TSPSSTSPSQQPSSPSQQPSTPDAAQTSTDAASSIEGCVGGSAGSWTLTDQTGKTWQLAGDTAKLGDHVGHQVRVMGYENSKGSDTSSGASSPGAGASSGSQPTFNVKKVKMISSSCSTGK